MRHKPSKHEAAFDRHRQHRAPPAARPVNEMQSTLLKAGARLRGDAPRLLLRVSVAWPCFAWRRRWWSRCFFSTGAKRGRGRPRRARASLAPLLAPRPRPGRPYSRRARRRRPRRPSGRAVSSRRPARPPAAWRRPGALPRRPFGAVLILVVVAALGDGAAPAWRWLRTLARGKLRVDVVLVGGLLEHGLLGGEAGADGGAAPEQRSAAPSSSGSLLSARPIAGSARPRRRAFVVRRRQRAARLPSPHRSRRLGPARRRPPRRRGGGDAHAASAPASTPRAAPSAMIGVGAAAAAWLSVSARQAASSWLPPPIPGRRCACAAGVALSACAASRSPRTSLICARSFLSCSSTARSRPRTRLAAGSRRRRRFVVVVGGVRSRPGAARALHHWRAAPAARSCSAPVAPPKAQGGGGRKPGGVGGMLSSAIAVLGAVAVSRSAVMRLDQ